MNRPAAAARSSDAAVDAELSLPGFALLFSTSLLPGVTRLDARPAGFAPLQGLGIAAGLLFGLWLQGLRLAWGRRLV
jgi:hypothetical protein